MREIAGADPQALIDAIADRSSSLVNTGAFEGDIRYQQKHYG